MFLGFYASLFEWLAPFHGLTPVYVPTAFLAMRFQWLTPFHVSGLTFNVSGFHVLAAFL